MWAHSGRELFYRKGNKMMVVSMDIGASLRATKPRQLFEGLFEASLGESANYDVARGDQRFLMIASQEKRTLTHLDLLLGWPEEAKMQILQGKEQNSDSILVRTSASDGRSSEF